MFTFLGFNNKQTTLAVFVDFKAGYDIVSINLLIRKMISSKVDGCLVRAIKDFLSQRFISVRFHDRTSRYKQTRRGVPQGAVSSTTLFNLMINDLCKLLRMVPGVEVILYADDLAAIISGILMVDLQERMNEVLKILYRWKKENEMEINTDKTKYQLFSMSNLKQRPNLRHGDVDLTETTSMTYLGFTLDQWLTFKDHAMEMAKHAQDRFKNLNSLAASTWELRYPLR